MRGIAWIGLTALAAVGGLYLHNEDVREAVEASEFAIGQSHPTFDEEMAALAPRVASGELDRRDAIEMAIEETIERTTRGDMASVSFTIGGDGDGRTYAEAIEEARERIDTTKATLAQLREEGEIGQERYSALLADLGVAEERLEALD